jgi:ABC-2 type transport system ATP-binding protein
VTVAPVASLPEPFPGAMAGSTLAGTGPAIETTELSKQYGSTVALAGLTMRVERGEVFGFLGPNGAGKTTAVKLLLGLARPTGGTGQMLGKPLGDRAARRRVGYLPELFRYQPWMRARDVLRLHCELSGIPRARWRDEIEGALATVNLSDRGADLVGRFSKGMQQRLGLGVALLGRPEVVFLDEPTSALDPVGRVAVRSIITAAREQGTAVFLNSHLLTEVERVCDRVAIVDRGRVVSEGRIDELLGESGVRVRVTAFDDADGRLAAFGPLTRDGDWLTIRPLDPARVPDVVEAIVRGGGRVHVVDPARSTLEDRFLALFSEPAGPAPAEPSGPAPAEPSGPPPAEPPTPGIGGS